MAETTTKKEETNGSVGTEEPTVKNEEKKKSWADEVEDSQDEATSSSAPAATSQEEKSEPSEEVKEQLGELSLSEEPAPLNEPDDANIQAVYFLLLLYSVSVRLHWIVYLILGIGLNYVIE